MKFKFSNGNKMLVIMYNNSSATLVPIPNTKAGINKQSFEYLADTMRMRFSNHGRNKKGFNSIRGYLNKRNFEWLTKYLPRIRKNIIGQRKCRSKTSAST